MEDRGVEEEGVMVGGVVPVGYRLAARKLHIDEEEAVTVRLIFALFLELGSVRALQRELRRRDIRTRVRSSPRAGSSAAST
ncbi:MAG TPA: hypothetical protein VGG77_03915 [Roseiarcus sp.]|jgi:hypothetical protein